MTAPATPAPQRSLWERFRRRWAHRLLAIEAIGLLALAAGAQRWVPMPRWSSVLGRPGAVPDAWKSHRIAALPLRAGDTIEVRVARAVRAASRVVPWSPRCLAEATAGQVLLRQLGAAGVVVIGLQPPDPDATPVQPRRRGHGPWAAHAWLLGRSGALTGGPAAKGFTATTVFEVPDALTAVDVDLA